MSRAAMTRSGAVSVDSPAGRVERWLTQPFDDSGWRGVAGRLFFGVAVGATLWGAVVAVIAGLAGQMSGRELAWAVVINEGAAVIVLAFAVWTAFRDVARLEAWEAEGRPSAEAQRMLRLVLTAPTRWATWAIGVYVVLGLPAVWAWNLATVKPMDFAIVLCVGGFLFSTVVAWPIAVLVGELGTRPVVARLCAEFPQVSAPQAPGMSLRTRALLPVPAVTLTTGICAGGLSGLFDEPIEQIGAAILVSLVFTGVIAMLLRFVVTEAALRPVDDLIAGVERIAGGDLVSRVPLTSADEIADNGRGYDATAIGPSAGLQNMADRIGALGGELHFESAPGSGTTVRGSVPVGAA